MCVCVSVCECVYIQYIRMYARYSLCTHADCDGLTSYRGSLPIDQRGNSYHADIWGRGKAVKSCGESICSPETLSNVALN